MTGEMDIVAGAMLKLWDADRLVFAPHRKGLLWHGPSTSDFLLTPNLFGPSQLLLSCVSAPRRTSVLLNWAGRDVYALDGNSRDIYICASLHRGSQDPHTRTLLVEIGAELLIVYEYGLLLLDASRRVRWKVDHDYVDLLFVGVSDGAAWYESENEGRWGYRVVDGQRVERRLSRPPI